jgi:hypothetical protein
LLLRYRNATSFQSSTKEARAKARDLDTDEKLRRDIQALGCSSGDTQQLLEVIARQTTAPVA